MISKSDLRRHLISLRQDFVKSHAYPWRTDGNWPVDLMNLAAKAKCVGGYVAVRTEANVTSLLDHLSTLGSTIALPYLSDRGADLEFRLHTKDNPLVRAPFGFQQPVSFAPAGLPDVILTPLVGFDRAMNRIGQGAGHYDRFFARQPGALRIGVAWSVQEVVSIHVDPWDMPLDAVITEKEWIIGKNSRITG